ncbi:hypothetical protein HY933_03745 [Candidatus Falkowbacteria bacterium]|nr:hypothetical protein [Candidatus Falkowbacteria bacterium]
MLHNILLKKITVFLTPAALFVCWELWLRLERSAVEVGLVSALLIVGALWYLTLRPLAVSQLQRSLHRAEFWRFLITPGLFVVAVYFFLLLLERPASRQFIIIGSVILLTIILQNLFDRFYRGARYPANSFESISGNVNSLSLFLLVAVAYGLLTFLDLPVWLLVGPLLVVATLLSYQTMWISGLELKQSWLYVLILDVIVVEMFWALLFLPNTFYVKALSLTAVYYVVINLSRNSLIDILNRTMIVRYVLTGGVVLGLILLTAQWR